VHPLRGRNVRLEAMSETEDALGSGPVPNQRIER
jgi:hypothetical protein